MIDIHPQMVFSDRNARLGAPILIFSRQNPRTNSSETLLRTQLAGQTVYVERSEPDFGRKTRNFGVKWCFQAEILV